MLMLIIINIYAKKLLLSLLVIQLVVFFLFQINFRIVTILAIIAVVLWYCMLTEGRENAKKAPK